VQTPLAWPITRMNIPTAMRENGPQIGTALEDVIKLDHFYFPQPSFSISECEEFCDSIVMG
jgi:hypothetical protein